MSSVYILHKEDTFAAVDGAGTVGFGKTPAAAKKAEAATPISYGQAVFTAFEGWQWVPQSTDESAPFFLRVRCNTCGHVPEAPYRNLVNGKIEQGCIDAIHDGQLYGSSLTWHNRPWAKQWRKDKKERRQALIAGRA